MILNKIFKILLGVHIATNLYAKPINLEKTKVDYINFNKISLNNFFGFLSKEYKINFSIEPEYKEYKISVHIQDTNLKNLLDIVTRDNGMVYEKKGDIFYIMPYKKNLERKYLANDYKRARVVLNYASVTDTVRFLLDMMPGQALLRSTTDNTPYSNLFDATPSLNAPKLEEKDDKTSIIPTLGASLASQANNFVIDKNIPKDALYIIPFYNSNTIYLLSSSQEIINSTKKLIKDIDQPMKQVLIQGQIMEFTINDSFTSIFDFSKNGSGMPKNSTASSIGVGNLQYAFLDSKIRANIDIAKRDGRASFVSSPMILTMNRVSATLDLTEDISIVTGVKGGSTSTNNGTSVIIPPTPVYETKKIGTQLTVTPYINNNDEILLKIKVNISSKSGNTQIIKVPLSSGASEEYAVDSISTSKIETLLTSANQQSIVFGGIIRKTVTQEEKRTPILGDIPILGIPFRNMVDINEKRELIIILTPIIVDLKNPQKGMVIDKLRDNVIKLNDDRKDFYTISKEEDKKTLLEQLGEKRKEKGDNNETKEKELIDEQKRKAEMEYDKTIREFLEE